MKPIVSIVLVAATALPTFAGKRIQFDVTDLATNKTSPRELLLDADRLKMDNGDSVIMFLTKGGNRLVMLDKKTNTYREMDDAYMAQIGQATNAVQAQMKGMTPEQQAQMEAMMAQMMKGKLGAAVAATTYTAKGAGTVAGYACTNYEGVKQGAKVSEICAAQPGAIKLSASDFQVLEKIRQFAASAQGNSQQGVGQLVPKLSITESGINGMPISTTNFENGKAVTREQLKSVTDSTFSDADFSTGSATKKEMPQIGATARGKAK